VTLSLYDVLGVPRDATSAQIKEAYRRMAKQHHPDAVGGDGVKFQKIAHAYAVLSSAARRKKYDETGDVGEPFDREHHVMLELVGLVFDKFMFQAIENEVAQYINVPQEMIRTLTELKGNHKKMIGGGEKVRAGLQDALTRIMKRPEKDILAEIVSSRIGAVENQITDLQTKLRVIEAATEHLKGYDYRADKKPARDRETWTRITGTMQMDEGMFEVMFDRATKAADAKK